MPTDEQLREALEDAWFIIKKLAGWQGMDLSELDVEYEGAISRIEACLLLEATDAD